ncbi:putative photosystem II stability/assembly factor, chloroplastic-like [Capsicum annuum]|uniref:LysM domain-containing protein n=1 Tax=Capsicum annuum TaxID=4072 RepID=A0A2G3A4M1_CAPAN|nr:uncharacterized protein LOC107857592 [Capsicum annuum]KAF3631018.1 putative photosystem II stability/assembly factor, chloroplastic-like [Capsicum annuum]PHT89189.1 hypothetical protein T459_04302 [Capsicum annuum]
MDWERRVNGGDYNNLTSSSSSSSSSYIQHPVSKFDTLAGVAIRYGVEVADIKRINGLVSDLQMFALKTLNIPLPGRHTPSPVLSNGQHTQRPRSSDQTSSSRRHSDLFDSFQSLKLKSSSPQPKVSPAMSSLQGYYGLKPPDEKAQSEGFEMAVYRKGGSHYLEDGPFYKSSPLSNPPLSLQRKSKSVANGFMSENGVPTNHLSTEDTRDNGSDRWFEKLVRRRQKLETDFTRTPEMLLKEDNSNNGWFSAVTGKGLALRPKSANRTLCGADAEASSISPIPTGLGDSFINDSASVVRKSSSTSNLQDSDTGTLSSLWNLKPDFQAISTAAITKPIFDGLPKPITGRRNKAALD